MDSSRFRRWKDKRRGHSMKILVLHGVNLNMFGKRDVAHYGNATLEDIDRELGALALELGAEVECFQTNHEGHMVERIHQALDDGTSGIVINAGAWTHYSYAIADALAILHVPVVETHMSRVFARESFRQHSVLAPLVAGSIAGFGTLSYLLAFRAVCALIRKKQDEK